MDNPDTIVRQLLDYFEARIDPGHAAAVRDRHHAALNYEPVDRLPLVFYVPYEGESFSPYPFNEALKDPAKMMVNELLVGFTSLYHTITLKDDAPYCLRPNFGTCIIASMFGARIRLLENNPPWTEPLGSLRALEALAEAPLPSLTDGLGQSVLDQYAYFNDVLRDYPRCKAAFQITLPDLQGPFSVVELLWGSGIYVDLFDRPALVHALLEKITDQIIAVVHAWSKHASENIGEGYCYQHAVGVRGNLLIRNDSMILLSPTMYDDIVRPYDTKLTAAVGSAGIHFCGRGQHQIDSLLSIPYCETIDFGQPEMNELDEIYTQAAKQKIALTRLNMPDGAWTAGQALKRFPTGVNLVYHPETVAEAQQVWAQYTERY